MEAFSACTPDEDCCRIEMEVEHVLVFKVYIAAEVFANDTLPGWEECFIEKLLEFFGDVDVLEFRLSCHPMLHELNCFQSHV